METMKTREATLARAALTLACVALVAAAGLALAACGGGTTGSNPSSATPSASPSTAAGPAAPTELPTPVPTPTVAGTIAFTSDYTRTGESNISVVRTDGSGLRRVIKSPVTDCNPAWSPDGRWIAYTVEDSRDHWTVAVARADGSDAHRLPIGREGGGYPAWSPDGTRLAYTGFEAATDGDLSIRTFVCDADGGDLRQASDDPGSAFDENPAWTPDGQAILFLRSESDRGPGDVYSVRPDGSGLTQVTSTGGLTAFALSPDGSQLAVDDLWNHRIALLPYDAGGPPTTLLAVDFDWTVSRISWSPDAKALVLGCNDDTRDDDNVLVIVNADGSGLSAIPGVVGREPQWLPE
jgi:Tol biopolymer transport system component